MANTQPRPRRLAVFLREVLAFGIWTYALIKLFVFDIDAYLLRSFAPGWEWLLNLKFLAIAVILALLWLMLGHRRFALAVTYIICYPLIVLLWKLPRRLWRRWAVLVILLPTIYNTIVSLRSIFVRYTFAALCATIIVLVTTPVLLVPSMVWLAVFLSILLYGAFRQAHSSSLFSQLAQLTRKSLPRINSGEFDKELGTTAPASEPHNTQAEPPPGSSGLPQLYLLHVIADFIAGEVASAMKSRRYNALLVVSLLNVVLHTTIIFAFENWALYKISPSSFAGADGASFFQFLAYSLDRLVSSNITAIQSLDPAAIVLAAAEVFCGFLIAVILVFSILTALRDTYREDLQDFSKALHEVATAIDNRILVRYSLTADELEIEIAVYGASTVNMLRRWRGLAEIPEIPEEAELLDTD